MTSREVWHVENHVCKLSGLTNGPVHKGDCCGTANASGVNYNVFKRHIKIYGSIVVRILSVDNVVIWEIGAGFQNWGIKWVTNDHSANIELNAALHQISTARDVHNSGLASGTHGGGASVWTICCSSYGQISANLP